MWRRPLLALAVIAVACSPTTRELDAPVATGPVVLPLGADLQEVVDAHPAGTTFALAAGIHREQQIRPRDGDQFVGQPGAVLSGAKVLTDFEEVGGRWSTAGQDQEGLVHGTALPGSERVRHPEDVWVDGRRLRHVASIDAVGPGTWHLDYAADELWLGEDPADRQVEVSTTGSAFDGGGVTGVRIADLVVERYASRAQRGAIDGHESSDWTIEDVEVRDNHAGGIGLGAGMRVHRAFVHGNGQIGVVGTPRPGGEPVELRDSRIVDNGHIGFDWRWEAGGVKVKHAVDGVVLAGNAVHGNGGPGLWIDVDSRAVVIEGNDVVANDGVGVFYEISDGPAVIADNVLRDNGADDFGVALRIVSAAAAVVRGNTIDALDVGVLVQQHARAPGEGARTLEDIEVVGNTIRAPRAVVVDGVDRSRFRQDVTFSDNRYPPSTGFLVDGQELDLDEWRAVTGEERAGAS